MEYKKNLVPGVALTVFSVIYLYLGLQIEVFKGSGSTPLDAKFMPLFWGTCLLILSLILVFRGIKERSAAIKEGLIKKEVQDGNIIYRNYEIILSFVFLAIYIALLQSIGFLIMTALYLTAEILLLSPKGKKRPLLTVIVAVVLAFLIDYVFVCWLNVLLPLGIFGF